MIELQVAVDTEFEGLAAVSEVAPGGGVAHQAHAVGLEQVVRVRGPTVFAQKSGAGHNHPADLAQRQCNEAGVFQMGDADGQIDPFFQQVHHPVHQHHAAAHLWVLLHETRDDGGDMHLAEQHRCGDGEVACGFGGGVVQRGFGIDHGRQQVTTTLQVAQALVGKRDAARGSVEQAHA